MSPLATLLGELRSRRGVRQKELACLTGYDQSYISALEVGTKGPPTEAFITKLIQALNLNQEEQCELASAVAMSDRKLLIPVNAPPILYELCYELRLMLDQLLPSQVEMMLKVLRLPHDLRLENTRAVAVKKQSKPAH